MESGFEIVNVEDAIDPVLTKIFPKNDILAEIMSDLPKKGIGKAR